MSPSGTKNPGSQKGSLQPFILSNLVRGVLSMELADTWSGIGMRAATSRLEQSRALASVDPIRDALPGRG